MESAFFNYPFRPWIVGAVAYLYLVQLYMLKSKRDNSLCRFGGIAFVLEFRAYAILYFGKVMMGNNLKICYLTDTLSIFFKFNCPPEKVRLLILCNVAVYKSGCLFNSIINRLAVFKLYLRA